MKLNYWRTVCVGFAFFLICAFWQAYDNIIPKILTDKFGMAQGWSGVVMALDNILALFMLPIFGAISDKCRSKMGRRTPFILVGTVIAVVAFISLSFIDNAQLSKIGTAADMSAEGVHKVYSETDIVTSKLKTHDGEEYVLSDLFTEEEMSIIAKFAVEEKKEDLTVAQAEVLSEQEIAVLEGLIEKNYEEIEKKFGPGEPALLTQLLIRLGVDSKLPGELTADETKALSRLIYKGDETHVFGEELNKKEIKVVSKQVNELRSVIESEWDTYFVPARQTYAAKVTASHRMILVMFMLVLLVTLLSMSVFRSPAVALMPDVTIKPLRSKANAVINLMGSFGGILVLALGILFGTGKAANAMMSYTVFFIVIGAIMLVALLIFLLTVKEPRFVKEMEEESRRYGIDDSEDDSGEGSRKLSKGEFTSLILILSSVALWYFGYNAVTSKYSVYAGKVLNLDYNLTLIIAQAAAIISYLPVGILSSKIGRKKAILIGVGMLTTAFAVAAFLRAGSPAILMNCMFALAGIGWATINVNSFPMVVELAKGGAVGKYTGYYYTASMAAQVLTPILSGFLMDAFGMRYVLFPYAAIFVALAFVTMSFVKHGDNKPTAKTGLEAFDVDD